MEDIRAHARGVVPASIAGGGGAADQQEEEERGSLSLLSPLSSLGRRPLMGVPPWLARAR
jgi:hypothetical protein